MQRHEQGSAASRRAADVRTTHDATCVQAQHVPAPGLLQQPVLGFQAERKRCLAAGECHLHKSRDTGTGTDTVCVWVVSVYGVSTIALLMCISF